MIKKGFKGRCQKRQMKKCKEVVRTYGAIQLAYAERLEQEDSIIEFQCNVMLSGLETGEYSSDFVCEKQNGDLMVRECVERRFLKKPMTVKLLDASREYWTRRGITDWGIVTDEEKCGLQDNQTWGQDFKDTGCRRGEGAGHRLCKDGDAKVDKSVRDKGRCGNPGGRVHGGDGAGYPGRDVCICQTDHA